MNEIIQTVDSEVFAIWFLIGAALVVWSVVLMTRDDT